MKNGVRISLKLQLIFVLNLIFICAAYAQKKIEVINADYLEFDKSRSGNIQKLIGNCVFRQDNVILSCDSAYLDTEANKVDAFSRVHIRQGDSLNLFADMLTYDGNSKKARLFKNVRVLHRDMTLTTENLDYDTESRLATYVNGGKLTDKENVLTSRNGYYYAGTSDAYFRYDVLLVNPDYRMKGDTLRYNTNTGISYFYGPTTIESEKDLLYTENGSYNTKTERAYFSRNSYYRSGSQELRGDSLFYDRRAGIGKAFQNISFIDTAEKLTLTGNYALYNERTEHTFVTGKALLRVEVDKDSMFLHADTLRAAYDSSHQYRVLYAYHHVRVFKSDFQARCDSLVFTYKDSVITCFNQPVVWAEGSQMTADLIRMGMKNGQFHNIMMDNAAFIVFPEDSLRFNQIRGKNMFGYFKDNKLVRLNVEGNGQSIYYAKEDSGDYIGVNRAECSNMLLLFKDNKADKITFITLPDATFYPINELSPAELKLKGFSWQEALRPKSLEDLFE